MQRLANKRIITALTINNKQWYGKYFPSESKCKAIIVVSGSDGGINWPSKIANAFARWGTSSLAVAYWKTKRTPKQLSLIPIETILYAVQWLSEQGFDTIGIYGFSKGAELALTAASLIPQIRFVIAVSPAGRIFEGIGKCGYSGKSSWTWNGNALPYAALGNFSATPLKNLFKNGDFGLLKQYLTVLETVKDDDSIIKTENINGPILLLSAREDSQWPSQKMGEYIVERLLSRRFQFNVTHKTFYPASHILCPVRSIKRFVFLQERKHGKECCKAREEAFDLSVKWIQNI